MQLDSHLCLIFTLRINRQLLFSEGKGKGSESFTERDRKILHTFRKITDLSGILSLIKELRTSR